MSMNQMPTPGGGAIPGSPAIRTGRAEQVLDLRRIMGSGLRELGEEMEKGTQGNPTRMARATAKIKQAQQALQGMAQAQQPQQPRTFRSSMGGPPRPADGQVDSLTLQRPADRNQSGGDKIAKDY